MKACLKSAMSELESYANAYMDTTQHKDDYVNRIKGTGEALDYLDEYGEDLHKVIENIQHVEEKQRAVKNDIHCIEGEKAELGYKAIRLVKNPKDSQGSDDHTTYGFCYIHFHISYII